MKLIGTNSQQFILHFTLTRVILKSRVYACLQHQKLGTVLGKIMPFKKDESSALHALSSNKILKPYFKASHLRNSLQIPQPSFKTSFETTSPCDLARELVKAMQTVKTQNQKPTQQSVLFQNEAILCTQESVKVE